MNVLVASHLALPHVGGVENLVDLELRALAAAGHRVTLVTSDGTGAGRTPEYPASVRVVRVPAWHGLERRFGIPYPLFGPRLLTTLWNEIRAADTVHAHGFLFANSALAVVLAKMQGKPCILTDHGGIQKFGSRLATHAARFGAETLGRLSAALATRVTTYNARIQSTMNRLGRRKDCEFIPNPVDPSLFFPPTAMERAAARAALGWPEGRKKVLFVGRLIAAKGVKLLLESRGDGFDLAFCGPGDASILESRAEYLSPRPQAQLRTLYHAADALALPAEVREGFPLVVQEAVACGLPVVLGYDPGFEPYRELPGLVFCERTPDAVRSAIERALAAGVALAEPGRPHPAEFFPTFERWVDRMYPSHAARPEVCLVRP
ncbi:MAG: glycosyltransferase family 4 protein [Gemmataceae bacterium]